MSWVKQKKRDNKFVKHELNDITALSDYAHLRYIYLSSNQLAELGPLSSIAQMLTLILDRNKIEQFNLPKMSYLQVSANFPWN